MPPAGHSNRYFLTASRRIAWRAALRLWQTDRSRRGGPRRRTNALRVHDESLRCGADVREWIARNQRQGVARPWRQHADIVRFHDGGACDPIANRFGGRAEGDLVADRDSLQRAEQTVTMTGHRAV